MQQTHGKAGAAFALRCAGLLSGTAGILFHLFFVNRFFKGGFMVQHNLAYFTLQTNIFSTLIFAVLVGKTLAQRRKTGRWQVVRISHSLHLACTYYITITMLGFWLLLAPTTGLNSHPAILLDSLLLHLFTPLLAILDSGFFGGHGGLGKGEALKWMSYPVLYLASVWVVARCITEPYYSFELAGKTVALRYPYPFLDPQVMGPGGVAAAVAVLALVFYGLALLYIAVDNRLAGKKKP